MTVSSTRETMKMTTLTMIIPTSLAVSITPISVIIADQTIQKTKKRNIPLIIAWLRVNPLKVKGHPASIPELVGWNQQFLFINRFDAYRMLQSIAALLFYFQIHICILVSTAIMKVTCVLVLHNVLRMHGQGGRNILFCSVHIQNLQNLILNCTLKFG